MVLKKYKKKNTPLYHNHKDLNAIIIDFEGWSMPLQYKSIFSEHLNTRRYAGLFDISHMGRFLISGRDSIDFLQNVLTNNVLLLEVGFSQYTLLSDKDGVAIDDAYLYRFFDNEFILVVNASNTEKDMKFLKEMSKRYKNITIRDVTDTISMLSIQGPESESQILSIISPEKLPKRKRNRLSIIKNKSCEILVSRTGYTGEFIGFELLIEKKYLRRIWNDLISAGAFPVGLGARDTLRLEAGLPLYGHELGVNFKGDKIPVFATPQAHTAVDLSGLKSNAIWYDALNSQRNALKKIVEGDYSVKRKLSMMIRRLELIGKSITRPGEEIFSGEKKIGYITSGTIVPYWIFKKSGNEKRITKNFKTRSIALAFINSEIKEKNIIEINTRSKKVKAVVMPHFLDGSTPPYSYPITLQDI